MLMQVFLFCLILYVLVNNFSVMSGWVFLGWTSTKQRIKCLAQGHNAVPSGEAITPNPSISSQALYHWATRLLLNAPITTKVVCFPPPLKCLRSLYRKQCGPRSDCSVSTLFASILKWSVMLGNCLQQKTSADDIFRCIFFLGALRV